MVTVSSVKSKSKAPHRNDFPRPVDHVLLAGGLPCLDFVNTVHDRHATVVEDYLSDVPRYLAWSVRAGLLTNAERLELDQSPPPQRVLAEVRKLREQIFSLLCEIIDGVKASKISPDQLDIWIHRGWNDLEFDPAADDCVSWKPGALNTYLPLKRVALSTLAFMQNLEPERLKRCAAKGECGWLFYDYSKNNRRRWCAMRTCGAIAKMRRYRRRPNNQSKVKP